MARTSAQLAREWKPGGSTIRVIVEDDDEGGCDARLVRDPRRVTSREPLLRQLDPRSDGLLSEGARVQPARQDRRLLPHSRRKGRIRRLEPTVGRQAPVDV